MAKVSNSRAARWQRAIDSAREDLEKAQQKKHEIEGAIGKLVDELNESIAPLRDSMQELIDIQGEFQEWYDNLPESLQGNSPVSEKLEAVIEFDFEFDIEDVEEPEIEVDLDDIEQMLDEAEDADLPRGFGRD